MFCQEVLMSTMGSMWLFLFGIVAFGYLLKWITPKPYGQPEVESDLEKVTLAEAIRRTGRGP